MAFHLTLLVLFLLLSGFFSSSETALFSLSRARVYHMAKEGGRADKLILKMKSKPHRLLATILIGNNLVNVGASAIATALAIQQFESNAIGIVTGVMTLLLLIFGEIIPKSLATQNNLLIARMVIFPISWFSMLCYPLILLLDFVPLLTGRLQRLPAITEEELISIVEVGEEEGEIKEEEKELIRNIFEFDDIPAYDIMTPRRDMFVVDLEEKPDLPAIMASGFSRIPLIQGNLDEVMGVMHVGDIFRFQTTRGRLPDFREIMRKPYFIPESKKIDTLLAQFKTRKQHMAIVIDEYGGVCGLVTLEDVLEEIVGEISDESDKDETLIKEVTQHEWILLGKIPVEDANRMLPEALPESPDYDTFSGFLLHHIGRIPTEGQTFVVASYLITVLTMDGNRILRLRVKYSPPGTINHSQEKQHKPDRE
ncbi:hemolysin family protein [Desulfobotulus sp. H1]|uniref:Hemolysin family protein n=1 Tax=Desulfobotulus pelophilus TaxID=2823377 RepID=A0ABT3NC71_9BACT|nr:hemolysin family protein [Desulfobotulus pelophilus]MCW7754771.1 hemolysin family protein [Desulfobotulus pelophilus]